MSFQPIKAKRRVFLTGTPVVNRPIELWPLIQSLDPQGLGKSFWGYASRYCAAHRTRFGLDTSGASNLDELQMRLRASVMVRRLKKDVLTELPPKVRQVIEIPADGMQHLVDAEASAYSGHKAKIDALTARAEQLRASNPAAYAAAVQELREATSVAFEEMARARHDLAVAKIPAVIEHLDSVVEAAGKVVVMCWHHDVVDAIAARYGRDAVAVTGKVPVEERQAAVERFQTDPTCTVFIGTIKAAGVGLTLTAASTVVFAELWWVPGDISQAEDRCHRIGQRDSVLVQHLVVDGSIDATQAKVIVAKQDVIDRALDVGQKQPEAPKQIAQPAAVERLFDAVKPLAPVASAPAPTGPLYAGIIETFDKAAANLKTPRVRLALGDDEVQLSRAGRESRNPGCVYVKVAGEYAGKIDRTGRLMLNAFGQGVEGDLRAVLAAFDADPEGEARAYGKLIGACCFCGRELTDSRSVEAGYGPDCSEKWGLPWG